MRKPVVILAVIAEAVLTLICVTGLAAEAFQPGQAKITASVLNVRNIASSGGQIVASVRRGDLVNVIERSVNTATVDTITDYWYKIALPAGRTGWVFGGYISFEVNLESGLRWHSLQPSGSEIFTGAAFFSTGEFIAGTLSGNLFITADRGKTFRKIVPQALGNSLGNIHKIVAKGNEIWIAAGGGEQGGVWRTTNNGASWTQFTADQGLTSNEVNDLAIMEDGSVWVATDAGISYTKDQGSTWLQYGPTLFQAGKTLCVAVLSASGTVFAGTESGVFVLRDEDRSSKKTAGWFRLGSSGRSEAKILSLLLTPQGDLFAGTSRGLMKTQAASPSVWAAIGGEVGVNHVFRDVSGRIIVCTDNGLNISLDHGSSWVTYKKEHGLAANIVLQAVVSPKEKTIWTISGGSGISFHE